MPLRLDIKRKMLARSDRVKCVDLHPTEPWLAVALYNGNVLVWNHEVVQLIKTFEVCDVPVRAVRFVGRKNWLVTGSDDMQLRVYNYNTLERIHAMDAHSDYIRSIAVHPTQPFLLTASDDMTIKLWNWEKMWSCQQVFEGHTHYVMQVVINPKDNNTFASASLDRTVKVWQLGSSSANFTLSGHQNGVNCIDYYHGGDKPYLISGADDMVAKVWDYQNKSCVQTLDGHSGNLTAVCFHPDLPVVMTAAEDGTVRLWHASTYRLETTLDYGLQRPWSFRADRGSNSVAIGYDDGCVMIKMGREEPAVSMDSSGRIVWARHSELQQANVKQTISEMSELSDGERLPLSVKDMGSCDIYPQTLAHNSNGRFVVVCGDGEYIIYTAMALRNKAFGSAQEFVWALDSSEYAVRENSTTIKLFKNFKENKTLKPDHGCEGIYGGYMLGVRSSLDLTFYDWQSLSLVRRIEIAARNVYWSESGQLVCISTEDSFYILKYSAESVSQAFQTREGLSEDGVDDAFDVLGEVQESVRTGLWVGDCFIYTNSVNRLNYYVGGEIITIAHLDRTMYLLGYMPTSSALCLCDKELQLCTFSLTVSVLEYQTAVMRSDFDTADQLLTQLPHDQRARVAHFLEKQGFRQQALTVSTDPEHKFELALKLKKLDVAHQLAIEQQSEAKWKQLADVATTMGQFQLAQQCLHEANDHAGLLLLATAAGNAEMVDKLAESSLAGGKNNIAFLSFFITNNKHKCLDVLIDSGRLPEAAFFARTYLPSQVSRVVGLWKTALATVSERAAQALADPQQYDNLFPEMTDTLAAEKLQPAPGTRVPARAAAHTPANWDRRPVEEMHAGIMQTDPPGMTNHNHQPHQSSTDQDSPLPHKETARVTDTGESSLQSDGDGTRVPSVSPPSMPPNTSRVREEMSDLDLELDNMNLDEDVDDVDVGDLNLDDEGLLED